MNGDAAYRLSYIDLGKNEVGTVDYTKHPQVLEGFNPATGRIIIIVKLAREEKI